MNALCLPRRPRLARSTIMVPNAGPIGRLLAFIRFSHTVFALPFALGSMFVAARGWPPARISLLIIAAMVFARTAAMTFNRLADWEIDRRNPRTSRRHLLIPRKGAIALLVLSSCAFVFTTRWINGICFFLSPLALLIVFFYSLTKRFTSFTHLFLGLALAVSPIGAWLAVTGRFAAAPIVLGMAVLFWVAGFDLIYALQDVEFDRQAGLKSLIVLLGPARSLAWAQRMHFATWLLLVAFGVVSGLGIFFHAALALILAALVYEHFSARATDIAAVNRAFFHSNAFIGMIFLLGTCADSLRK